MNAEMILSGIMAAGVALSFALLFRARKLSVELWSRHTSYQTLSNEHHLKSAAEKGLMFKQ